LAQGCGIEGTSQATSAQPDILSNHGPISVISLLNGFMATAWAVDLARQRLCLEQSIISNFLQIREIPMVNAGMANASAKGAEFQRT
jgi:hypothetical protein